MRRIYYLRPGRPAEIRHVEGDLESIHDLLDGGTVEQIGWRGQLSALVDTNAEGKALARSCIIDSRIVAGPVIFCRYENAKMVDLTDDDVMMLQEHIETWTFT